MKTTLFLLTALCFSLIISAQELHISVKDTVGAEKMLHQIDTLIKKREYAAALELVKGVKPDFINAFGARSPLLADLVNFEGEVYYYTRDMEQAVQAFNQLLSIRQEHFGPEAPETLLAYRSLAICYNRAQDYKKAIEVGEALLKIYSGQSKAPTHDKADALVIIGNAYTSLIDYDFAVIYQERALQERLYAEPKDLRKVARDHNSVGYAYFQMGENDKAIKHYAAALDLLTGLFGDADLNLVLPLGNLASANQTKGDYRAAVELQQKAIDILIAHAQGNEYTLALSYNNLGTCFADMNDYAKALQFHEKALAIKKEAFPEDYANLALSYNNIGSCYQSMFDPERAAPIYRQAVSFQEQVAQGGEKALGIYLNNEGTVLLELGQIEAAIAVHERALEVQETVLPEQHQDLALSHLNYGVALENQGRHSEALNHFQQALEIWEAVFGPRHYRVASAHKHLGDHYALEGNLDQARWQYEQSLLANGWSEESFASVISIEFLLNTLEAYSELYIRDRQKLNYDSAVVWSDLAIDALRYQQKALSSAASRLPWLQRYQRLFEKGIGNRLHGKMPEAQLDPVLFRYAEESKSAILYRQLQEANALHYAGIPDSLLEKEYDLRVDLTYYENRRQEKLAQGLEETDTMVLAISSKLFDLNQAYDSLKAQLESNYPEYYKLKYDLSTVNVEEVQMEILEEGQALLEYFAGDSSIIIFRVEKDKYEVKEVKRDFPLEEWVQQLRDNISQPMTFAYEAYLEVAPKLYEKLIAPVADGLPEKLVIVPDGILGYIPFEALLKGEPDARNLYAAERLPYLLREHQVSYCYSATLLKEMKEKRHRKAPTRELLAVAPFANVDTVLSSHLDQSDWLASNRSDTLWGLPYTQAELDSIQRVFETDAFYGAEATESVFVDRAGAYRILHLSTHGKADPRVGDYSYLAFYPQPDSLENELLYVRDLYNLQLNADLVVLSACETGAGELQRGEGIISLARAFAYAGAKSITTTLWQVNDKSTQELMVSFYQHLKSGMTKDAALRQAKLDFLDGHQDIAAHPFFWAAFIGVGDMGRL
jgi:CHAT domain-containing protein/tetratricopeptide (TPR) repeat protein